VKLQTGTVIYIHMFHNFYYKIRTEINIVIISYIEITLTNISAVCVFN